MNNKVKDKQTMDQKEISVSRRWYIHHVIQAVLKLYPRDADLSILKDIIQLKHQLGKGAYGTVYAAQIQNRTVAIKSVGAEVTDAEQKVVFEKLLREEMAHIYLNALVFLKVCPNYTLVHASFFSQHRHQKGLYCFLMCVEKADGDMKKWIEGQQYGHLHDQTTLFHAIFQVVMGIVCYITHLDITHNDLYLKNILYTDYTEPTTISYSFDGEEYRLYQTRYLFQIADFGICSSPKYLLNDHDEIQKTYTKQNRHCSSFLTFNFNNHIIEYGNIHRYVRDIAVFFRSLLVYVKVMDKGCGQWLQNSLYVLDNYKVETLQQFRKYVKHIFSEEFMSAASLDKSQLFDMFPSSSINECFNIDGNPDTAKNVLHIANDYIKTKKMDPNEAGGPCTPMPNTPHTFS